MDFRWTSGLTALAEQAAAVGQRAASGRPFHEDSWIAQPDREFARELADRGWIGMTWPSELGGGGRDPLERFVVYEALITTGAPIASAWLVDRQMGPSLLQFGTDGQRERWLPGMVAAEAMWCIGMSEPDAGSDVASLRTRATRSAGGWVVSGQKVWNSGGAEADWCYLIARTDPEAPKHRGLSEFAVDMHSPGITVRPIADMTGDDHFCEIIFDEVVVPADNLIGTENNSFRQVMRQMELERGGIDRLVSNRRLFLECVDMCDRSDPTVRDEIARLESKFRIGRQLVLRETLQQAPAGFSALTKTFATEFEVEVAAFCSRVLGPHACLADEGLRRRVSRNVCYSPAYTIMGGTTQILRNVLGDRVLGLPR